MYGIIDCDIMATFFREKVTASTVTSIILALVGIGLLYKGDAGVSLARWLSAVLLIVMGKSFHLRTITHTITTLVRKTWRWKS